MVISDNITLSILDSSNNIVNKEECISLLEPSDKNIETELDNVIDSCDDTDTINSDNSSSTDYDDTSDEEGSDEFHQFADSEYNRFFTNDERIMFPSSNLTVSDTLMMLKAINIRFNHTRDEQKALLQLVKTLAGPQFVNWYYSPYLLSKAVSPPKEKMIKHYYCSNSNISLTQMFLSEMKKKTIQCEKCKNMIKISSKSTNFFVTLDVKYQLKNLFNNKKVQKSFFKFTKESSHRKKNDISDIYDSKLYKKFFNQNDSDILTLNFSTDGSQLFKSAKKALWPLQLHLNCFSGKLRFKHPIIVALWQTEQEPTADFMNLYMTVFKEECDQLSNTGIEIIDHETGVVYKKRIVPFCCCVDTVARPILQNRIQFSGYYGCSWCYHIGQYKEKAMRYPLIDNYDSELRTHEKHKEHVENVKKKQSCL
uniref:DUF4211 domain-containing protein n=1 Tax=Trichogramma kaykai TaxID=54128 RepID=A0ABD2WA81_9HYME